MRKATLTELFTGLMPPAEEQFISFGGACQFMQIMPAQLQVLMADCDVRFVRVIDAVPYLDANGFEAVVSKCKEIQAEIVKAQSSVASN